MPVSTFTHADRAPSASIYNDISFINTLNNEVLLDLAATCYGSGGQHLALDDTIDALALQNGYSTIKFHQVSSTLSLLLNNFSTKNLSVEQIQQDLLQLGMDSEKADTLAKLCASIGEEDKTISHGVDIHQLVDLEWKFGVTAASSELNKVGATFLQLKLTVTNQKGKLDTVHMELSLEQFYSFLLELEKAKTSLDSIR